MKVSGWIAVAGAVALLTACTSGRPPAPAPSTSPPPPSGGGSGSNVAPSASPALLCNGTGGKALLTGLLADLNAGRTPALATYFSPPIDFVRWWDPTTPEVITFLPGPGSGTVTLDALQAHLEELAGGGFSVRLVDFADAGYQGSAQNGDAGGWFEFDLRGHSAGTATRDGGGKGAVDCASGRLKVLVVDGW